MSEWLYTPPTMTYDELAQFAASMPRIPKRELKCHPSVTEALRNYTRDGEYTVYDEVMAKLTGIDIFEVETMDSGAWEIFEDDVLKASGNIGCTWRLR